MRNVMCFRIFFKRIHRQQLCFHSLHSQSLFSELQVLRYEEMTLAGNRLRADWQRTRLRWNQQHTSGPLASDLNSIAPAGRNYTVLYSISNRSCDTDSLLHE